MEARLAKQILMIIGADKAGHLTPEIQNEISNALDHLHRQLAPGGAVGAIQSPLARYMPPPVKVPRTSFPKLPAAPKLPGLKT
jgi:hypothetical protein